MIDVRVTRLAHGEGLEASYATDGAAGLDLPAANDAAAPITLGPFERAMVPTGLSIALPAGYEGQVRPRSGLAARHGISVLNSPGTIDSDYRGEVMVILVNLSDTPFTVRRGERIAQLVVAPVSRVRLVPSERLEESARGAGGFGSTGR